MPHADQLQQALANLNEHGSLALDGLLGFCLLWGVFLWLLGTRVVRANFAMQGLIFGAIAAGLIARGQGLSPVAAYIAVGGIAGAAIVYLTYRLWIALALAVTLAVLTPLGVVAFHNSPPPDPTQPIAELTNEVKDEAQKLRDLIPDLGDLGDISDIGADPGAAPDATDPQADDATLGDRANAVIRSFADAVVAWWRDDLTNGIRAIVVVGTLAASATGVLVGLVAPNLAAAVVSSSVGSALLLLSITVLSQRHLGSVAQYLPTGLRGVVAVILVATAIGAIIQWTIVRPKADD